jgi:hypothetical protein
MVDGPASEPADATPDAAAMLLRREKFVNSVVLCESASNKFLQHFSQPRDFLCGGFPRSRWRSSTILFAAWPFFQLCQFAFQSQKKFFAFDSFHFTRVPQFLCEQFDGFIERARVLFQFVKALPLFANARAIFLQLTNDVEQRHEPLHERFPHISRKEWL